MSYVHDVFISYRRFKRWPTWVKDWFLPPFEHWLGEELGREPNIFLDEHITEGSSWPETLALEISRARVLVGLWSPMYFDSEWCTAELAHMYTREDEAGLRSGEEPGGLIVPASLHDGDSFPKKAQAIKPFELHAWANPFLVQGSPTAEALAEQLREFAGPVAAAVGRAPVHKEAWLELSSDEFLHLFKTTEPRQAKLPGLG